jgi:hypothetical protein
VWLVGVISAVIIVSVAAAPRSSTSGVHPQGHRSNPGVNLVDERRARGADDDDPEHPEADEQQDHHPDGQPRPDPHVLPPLPVEPAV